jgi:type IV pilus assembly protein PilQ
MRIYSEDNKVIIVVHSLDRIALTDIKDGDDISFKINRRTSRVTNFNVNEPITIAFKDAPVELVLQVLSEFAGLNLVISSSVRGNISIDLKNVPWNEVMNIVLISKGLATKKMNSIMYIATAAEIAAQEQLELQTKRSLENNAVLVTRFIPLNYTTAQAAQSVITSMAKMNGGVMSPRGSITSDTRTNTLIITDTEEKIPLIKNVISEIDIPSDQVLVETRIVEVTRDSGFEIGFNWAVNNIHMNTFSDKQTTSASGEVSPDFVGTTADIAWTMFGGMKIQLEVKALESSSLASEVASPHLVVANNETASIAQGKKVPYKQTTASGAGAISFQDAELKLEVTPQIAPDGYIVLELDITKNSVGATLDPEIPPQISTKSIVTKLMVKDGQTIVIGGIYDKKKTESKTKVPLLGDIPYLGYLFSYTKIEDNDVELLIFVTSTILESKIE